MTIAEIRDVFVAWLAQADDSAALVVNKVQEFAAAAWDWASPFLHEAGQTLDRIFDWAWPSIEPAVDQLVRVSGVRDPETLVPWTIAAVAVVCILAIFVLRHRSRKGQTAVPLSTYVQSPRRLGWTTIALVFGVGGGLAYAVPLSGAAVAPGVVSPDGSRKTVQHLEGGIVSQINVREGDIVEAGQSLLTLRDTQARAELTELRDQLVHLTASEARLIAEQTDQAAVEAPQIDGLSDPEILRNAVAGQQVLLESRRAARNGRERVLQQRILQLREESTGFQEVVAAQDEEAELLRRQIANIQSLVDKRYARTSTLIELQRTLAELRGERATNQAKIASNEQAVGETEMQLLSARQDAREKVDEELTKVRAELAGVRSRLPARMDILDRTVVAAPIGGTVMNIKVTTKTGVVRPGEPLMEIVPNDAKLIVDARVRPIDIDVLYPGMQAKVVLSAYTQRNLPQIHGTLRSISADRLTDERTGESYFLAKVEVDADLLAHLKDPLELVPGMPADVFILTGERTALDYLIRPFIQSITKSFRES